MIDVIFLIEQARRAGAQTLQQLAEVDSGEETCGVGWYGRIGCLTHLVVPTK